MCGVDVTITDDTIKTPDRKWDRWREWRHARKQWAEDFWDLKKDSELRFGLGRRKSIFGAPRSQTSSLQRGAVRGGVRWKSQHRKKLCLSLLMLKNLKLKKVIKSFIPEPKKRVVRILCFRIPMFYEDSMNICLFHVFVFWSYIFGREYITVGSWCVDMLYVLKAAQIKCNIPIH